MHHAVSSPGDPMNQLTRCNRLIQIRAPEFMIKALDSAADKRLTSRSDYIRIALLDRLRADGIGAAAFMAIALIAVPAAAQVQAGHHHKNRAPVSYIVDFPLILGIGY
jgi:hypothetical protein